MRSFTFVPLDVAKLTDEEREQYATLAPLKFRCCLWSHNPDGIPGTKTVAIAVVKDGSPVGLLLASLFVALRRVDVHSFFIFDAFYQADCLSQMLAALEKETAAKNCSTLTLTFIAEDPHAAIVEQVLKQRQWDSPILLITHCFVVTKFFHPPWIHQQVVLPEGFEIFLWSSLTKNDREQLQRRQQQNAVPLIVSPLKDEEKIEPLNSLGLRFKGEVVGWMITHRVDPLTIQYDSFYLEKKLQQTGVAMRLLRDSVNRHIRSSVPLAVFEVNKFQVPPTYFSFAMEHYVPYATAVTHTKISSKKI